MKRVLTYLNPLAHLGDSQYSVWFPLITNVTFIVLSELVQWLLLANGNVAGTYIIFFNVALILYFAFRDGIKGGFISSFSAIGYYFFIVYSRHFEGQQLYTAINTTLVFGLLYILLAFIIGWLKQSIDKLIEREADQKRRLETIIQQLPVGILITDSEGYLTQRNRTLDSIIGSQLPLGFKVGQDTLTNYKVNGTAINPAQSPLVQALKTGKRVIGKSLEIERSDGKKLSLMISSAPILNKKGKIMAAASIISDVTKQKELERQKDEFLGIASHELKTPVTSIKAYGQVLQATFKRQGDVRAVQLLEKMDGQINKLTNLIGDLLDVTKIQSGRIKFYETNFELNTLILEVMEELQVTTDKHSIIAQLAQPVEVFADRDRISQVLTNLISNAIKYSPTSDKILIKSEVGKIVTVSVQDFGIGIPSDKKKRVFEQFFRVSGVKESTFPGLGLGLYISAEIIKREGGKIGVESHLGKGSTFFFSLPITKKVGKRSR